MAEKSTYIWLKQVEFGRCLASLDHRPSKQSIKNVIDGVGWPSGLKPILKKQQHCPSWSAVHDGPLIMSKHSNWVCDRRLSLSIGGVANETLTQVWETYEECTNTMQTAGGTTAARRNCWGWGYTERRSEVTSRGKGGEGRSERRRYAVNPTHRLAAYFSSAGDLWLAATGARAVAKP